MMKKKLSRWFLVVGLAASLAGIGRHAVSAPEIPGAPQRQPIALVGATVHPVSGPAIPEGIVVFENGSITAVGKRVEIPEDAQRVALDGKHVYPALFDPYTNVGLVEINAVRASLDHRESGQINPNVKAQLAVNPDSELIPVTRSNGVLLVLTAPTGGLLGGQSAVLQLDGWTWEDMTLRGGVGMHVDWPRMASVTDGPPSQSGDRDSALRRLQETFDDARAYQKARQAVEPRQPVDSRWQAMLAVLKREMPLIVSADDAMQIQAAIAFAHRENVRIIIYGGYDAPHCAELLRAHEIPVIVGGVYRLPRRRSDPYDTAFTLPERLRQAGIHYCISGSERSSNVRNLPYHAAMAAAFGLPADEALKAITLYPARILGVEHRVGSLEVGKDATLFVADGDPLETKTQIEGAYVQGREVDLNDRHKRLYQKYQEKYRRQTGR